MKFLNGSFRGPGCSASRRRGQQQLGGMQSLDSWSHACTNLNGARPRSVLGNTSPKREREGPDRPGVTRTTWRSPNTSAPVFLRALARTPSLALRAGMKSGRARRWFRKYQPEAQARGSGSAWSDADNLEVSQYVGACLPASSRADPLACAFWCCAHQSWSGLEYQPEARARGSGSAGSDADNLEVSQYVGACVPASSRAGPPRLRVLVLRSPVVVGSGIPARSASEGVRIGRE